VTGDDVREVTFPYRFNGYSPSHVDLFLFRIADLLDDGQLAEDVVLHDRFPRVMRGYDTAAVDEFVNSLVRGGPVASQL
jgi:DivIVA domain-containing protein